MLAAVVALLIGSAISWRTMNIVESELLTPDGLSETVTLEVVGVAGSRITFKDEGDAAIDGVWGIVGPSGYGQITRVISRDNAGVVRGLALLSGSFSVGEVVELDASAYPEDPRSAHGLPFEEIRVPSDLGVNPAWLITGENDTWIVFVHGADGNGRTQALRAIPTFRKLGFPVLVITYRDDASGGAGDDLRYAWGLDEWRDVDAALATATLRGADDFILVGHGMGASIISTFLHESELTPNVRGVIFDSAVLDLEEVIDEIARDRGIPGYLATIGKSIARIRFGLEWSRLDQLERVLEFDPSLPMLVLHGTDDTVAPITMTDAFAAALPLATYERFRGAVHGALWNSAPVRYEESLTDFLIGVTPGLASES